MACALRLPKAGSVCSGRVWVVLLLLSPYHGVLAVVEIRAQDHIIVSSEGPVSLAERGLL